MPSDFIPAISPERWEYIAAAGSLAIKHATVSPLPCRAAPRAQTALQGFPIILISLLNSYGPVWRWVSFRLPLISLNSPNSGCKGVIESGLRFNAMSRRVLFVGLAVLLFARNLAPQQPGGWHDPSPH